MLPHWLNPDFEEVVIGTGVETGGWSDVIEDSPKILNHIECCNLKTHHLGQEMLSHKEANQLTFFKFCDQSLAPSRF